MKDSLVVVTGAGGFIGGALNRILQPANSLGFARLILNRSIVYQLFSESKIWFWT